MGPAYFIIAIMGCSDAGLECRTAATPPARYGSEQSCRAARGDALMANTDLDFPTLLARCVPGRHKASVSEPEPPRGDSVAA
jgi:hypothetical protein